MRISIFRFFYSWRIQGNQDKLKVLLAEDDRWEGKKYEESLCSAGFDVDRAGNGVELVDAAEQFFYHIIASDTDMPRMDGDQACAVLLQNSIGYRECTDNKGCIIALSNKIDHLDLWQGIAHETRYKRGIDDLGKTVKSIYEGFCIGDKKRFKEHLR